MSVEIQEEAMMASPNCNSSSSVSNDQCSAGMAKGKRTKRQRQLLQSSSSTTSYSGEYYSGSATEEEEDMANCLILLAQGRALDAGRHHPEAPPAEEEAAVGAWGVRFTGRRAAPPEGKALGCYVYECKTCSKRFPSFQALGGHRASHKKPKTAPAAMATEENKPAAAAAEGVCTPGQPAIPGVLPNHAGAKAAEPAPATTNSVAAGNSKPRVHECSICGSEFSSGQALGGHMRRHRAAAAAASPEPPPEAKKEKNVRYCLDLNLPAPMEDERGDLPKAAPFPSFPAAKQTLIFSASPLVGCHY